MEEVDIVIVGAEGVAESGGVINKVEFLSQEGLFHSKFYLNCYGTVCALVVQTD